MKINNIGPMNVNPYKKQLDKTEKVQKAAGKDKIEISSTALEMQKGSRIEAERQEKIKALASKINSGEYQINAQDLAKKVYQFWSK